MSKRLLAGIVVGASLGLLSLSAAAAPLPPACVVVAAPVHAQVGYAPDGPAGCTTLP